MCIYMKILIKKVIKKRQEKKTRQRGRKGGVRARNKQRRFKPRLPTVILGNVQSLNNKMDEMRANVASIEDVRTCSLLCFTDTWIGESVSESNVCIEGFTSFRGDRTKESGKGTGGGVCVFVNKQWSHTNNVTVFLFFFFCFFRMPSTSLWGV